MRRCKPLRRLAAQRREWVADALKCESEADDARQEHVKDVWRTKAHVWWRLVAEASAHYESTVAKYQERA